MWLVERTREIGYDGSETKILFVTANDIYARDFVTAATIECEAAATLKAPDWLPKMSGADFKKKQEEFIDQIKNICKLDTWMEDMDFLSTNEISYKAVEVEVR